MKRNVLSLLAAVLMFAMATKAQMSAYTFSALSDTYTPTSAGATKIVDTLEEGYGTSNNAIGFAFRFSGVDYTTFYASPLGFISFNASPVDLQYNNYHSLANSANRPMIAPWYDDERTGSNTGGVFSELSGTAPDRVLTIEWRHNRWWWSGNDSTISFEVKLYETSNRIEFVYQRGYYYAGPLFGDSSSVGATIGIADDTGFISVLSADVTPAISSVDENDTIYTEPLTGQIYRFDGPATPTAINTPVKSELKIATLNAHGVYRISHAEAGSVISVYNTLGQQLYAKTSSGSFTDVDITSAEPGMYIIGLTGNGPTQTRRVIKY